MSLYKQYKRSAIAQMAEFVPGMNMANVSVGEADIKNGSPKEGDMIARNPDNHDDKCWSLPPTSLPILSLWIRRADR